MALVTIQVLEGLERGKIYSNLSTPVTIGREDDNVIRLNDERVSRFHAKIQEDGDRIILTDLDSTNGTRVNGHPVQLRVLQAGDQVWVGRCLLVYGSPEEIAAVRARIPVKHLDDDYTVHASAPSGSSAEVVEPSIEDYGDLFPSGPPDPPDGLTTAQRAEVSDMLAYTHDEILKVLAAGKQDPRTTAVNPGPVSVEWGAWQDLSRLGMLLATYLRKIAEPEQ